MKKVALSAAVCAMAFSANADVETSAFNSIYGGLGIGGSFLESNVHYTNADGKDKKVKANRVIGSAVLGGGKVFSNNVYAGGEFMLDFAKNKKFEGTFPWGNGCSKVMGIVPQINAKAGYVFKNDLLAYGKLGCAWSKGKTENYDRNEKFSKTKASFVLGAGVEKAFCKKFSAAVDADYNFGWKQLGVRFNKGWNVRALVKYNVQY